MRERNNVEFSCSHIEDVVKYVATAPQEELTTDECRYYFINSYIHSGTSINFRTRLQSAQLDEDHEQQVKAILDESERVVGFKINKFAYIIKSKESAACPLGWQHVYIDKGLCCGLR